MRFMVVSCPATNSSMTVLVSSSSDRRSPCSSTASRALDQVVGRTGPALGEQLLEVGHEVEGRLQPPLQQLGVDVVVEEAGGVRRPAGEVVAVVQRHAEHLADHGDRQLEAEVGHDVEAPGIGGLVEDAVHQLLDAGSQPLDGARGEALGHQLAQPGVVGRIHEQHGPLVLFLQQGAQVALGVLRGAGRRACCWTRSAWSRSTASQSAWRVSTQSPSGLRHTGASVRMRS